MANMAETGDHLDLTMNNINEDLDLQLIANEAMDILPDDVNAGSILPADEPAASKDIATTAASKNTKASDVAAAAEGGHAVRITFTFDEISIFASSFTLVFACISKLPSLMSSLFSYYFISCPVLLQYLFRLERRASLFYKI